MESKYTIEFKIFDYLRIPLMLIVVLYHVFSVGINTCLIVTDVDKCIIYDSLRGIINIMGNGVVPIFFFMSGYLFFLSKPFNVKVYAIKLKNRFRTLFVPYIIWNSLAIILVLIKSLPIFNSFLTHEGTGVDLSMSNILSCFWMYDGKLSAPPPNVENYGVYIQETHYPINTALWYIRDLMIVVIFTPILYILIKKLRIFVLILIGGGYVFLNYSNLDYHYLQLSTAFFFFSWGAYFSINDINMVGVFKKIFIPSIILFSLTAFFILYGVDMKSFTTLKILNIFASLVSAFCISAKFVESNVFKINRTLVTPSFFVYVSHCLITARLTKVLVMLVKPQSDGEMCFVYLTSFVITIILLLSIYKLMDKYIPSVLRVITGRR
jgi:hypothetical protein